MDDSSMSAVQIIFYLCLLDVEESSFFRATLERCKVKPCNYHIAGLFLYFDKRLILIKILYDLCIALILFH